MARHARGLTKGQAALAAVIAFLAAAVTPVFFIVMFLTVNQMLGPYFDGWAWTAPVATEIVFVMLFLSAALLEWLRRPSHALWLAPYPFAVMSAFLNVWAFHGSVPGMAGHLAVTLAFFTPVTFAKMGVRRLMVTDEEKARALALADATAHARDMLRSELGLFWKHRTPVLLRRQLRSGRLPAAVMGAVESGSAAAQEAAVEAWVASAVTLPERFSASLAAAREEASARPAQSPPETPSQEPAPEAPAAPAATPPASPRSASPRPRRLVPSKASDEDLAEIIVPLLGERDMSATGVVKVIRERAGGKASIGHERAGTVLALARQQAQRVVPIGERRQA